MEAHVVHPGPKTSKVPTCKVNNATEKEGKNPLEIHLPGSLETKKWFQMEANIHPIKLMGLSASCWAILLYLEPSKVLSSILDLEAWL